MSVLNEATSALDDTAMGAPDGTTALSTSMPRSLLSMLLFSPLSLDFLRCSCDSFAAQRALDEVFIPLFRYLQLWLVLRILLQPAYALLPSTRILRDYLTSPLAAPTRHTERIRKVELLVPDRPLSHARPCNEPFPIS